MADTSLSPLRDGALRLPQISANAPVLIGAALVAALVLLPLAALVEIAAQGSGPLWEHLLSYVLPEALRQTSLLLLGVGVLTLILAVPTAWLIATTRFPGHGLFEWALLLPLAVPGYIVAYSYLDVLHPLGPVQGALRALLGYTSPRQFALPDMRSLWGGIFVLSFVLYPYVYLSARASFLLQSASALEVARTLGARRLSVFLRIALPLARPAIIAGMTLVLLETLGDIGASEFLGVRTLTVSIYATWVNRSNLPGAAQIALVMLVIVLLIIVAERAARRSRRYSGTGTTRPLAPAVLRGPAAFGAMALCAFPVLIGFVVPVAHLAAMAASRIAFAGIPAGLLEEARTTALIALATTVVALSLGFLVAMAHRLVRGSATTLMARIASLGYAVPGTVLAIGLLTPMAGLDNIIDGLSARFLGVHTGLLISGSGAALVLALTVRFLTIPIGTLEAGYGKLSPHLDMAARSLGCTAPATVRRVHLPLLKPAIATAALLVFVDAMKELPATLLLRPLGLETLATHIYGEAARGTYEDGALAALVIIAVGLGPVILLARLSRAAISSSQGRSASGVSGSR